jgi:hypothetical protein
MREARFEWGLSVVVGICYANTIDPRPEYHMLRAETCLSRGILYVKRLHRNNHFTGIGHACANAHNVRKTSLFLLLSRHIMAQTMNSDAPPANWLDTGALVQTARDKLAQVADEVKLLQTDSEYTRDYVLAIKADRRWDDNVSSALKWDHIAGKFANEAISQLELWHDIVTACTKLHGACQEYEVATSLPPGAPVSVEVSRALAALQKLLYDYKRFQTDMLLSAISGMHAMKDTYSISSEGGVVFPRTVFTDVPQPQSKRIHEAFAFFTQR